MRYFFKCWGRIYIFQIAFKDSIFTVWFGLPLLVLWAISYLDWHYQLISTTLCLWLLTIGLFGADNNFSLLTLSESIKSAASFFFFFFFIVFYAVYWIAKFYYGKKPLGGRLLASNGIRKFYSFRNRTALLLLASVLGICFSLIHKKKKNLYLCPFMNLSAVIIYFVKYYWY